MPGSGAEAECLKPGWPRRSPRIQPPGSSAWESGPFILSLLFRRSGIPHMAPSRRRHNAQWWPDPYPRPSRSAWAARGLGVPTSHWVPSGSSLAASCCGPGDTAMDAKASIRHGAKWCLQPVPIPSAKILGYTDTLTPILHHYPSHLLLPCIPSVLQGAGCPFCSFAPVLIGRKGRGPIKTHPDAADGYLERAAPHSRPLHGAVWMYLS